MNYAMNHEFGDTDRYSIYTPSCPAATATSSPDATSGVAPLRFKNTLLRRRRYGYDPCTENYAEKYYNRPEV